MSLSTGTYTIRSAAFSQPYVGRNLAEDFSRGPKKILSLPDDVEPHAWEIENLGNGRYSLRAGGAPTAIINDLVFAILGGPSDEEWSLEQLPQYGDNQYLIQSNSGPTGWVLPSQEPRTQIASRLLIVQPSFPPQYPAHERWIIESLNNLD